jgi:tetratricopeptide (TPR) repeat protein
LIAGRARLSHLLLLCGGVVLLSRGTRFIWEWALLALPLLGYRAATLHSEARGGHTVSPSRVIGLALLAMPLITLGTKIDTSKPYPFDDEGLPVGTTTFLRERGAMGNLLMNPSLAGYAQWMLSPRIRIFADMELPPFNDWDMYRIYSANKSAEAFKRIVAEYPIDFVLVELRSRPMAGFIKVSNNFAPIFFDDSAVLYAHRELQAALVSKYELRAVNPFTLLAENNLFDEKRLLDERLLELEIVQDLFPAGNRALHALTRLLVDAKRYPEAEKWADRFLEGHSRDPNSHLLKGVILENTDRCPEAIAHFENAFRFSGKDFHPALHQHLGTCRYLSKEFTEAFEHFSEGVNVYLRHEPSETLYQYAFSAVIAGDAARARMLLKAILYQIREEEELVRNRARGLLAKLDSDPSLSEGFLGSLMP